MNWRQRFNRFQRSDQLILNKKIDTTLSNFMIFVLKIEEDLNTMMDTSQIELHA